MGVWTPRIRPSRLDECRILRARFIRMRIPQQSCLSSVGCAATCENPCVPSDLIRSHQRFNGQDCSLLKIFSDAVSKGEKQDSHTSPSCPFDVPRANAPARSGYRHRLIALTGRYSLAVSPKQLEVNAYSIMLDRHISCHWWIIQTQLRNVMLDINRSWLPEILECSSDVGFNTNPNTDIGKFACNDATRFHLTPCTLPS
jgi:hypothetical protein